MKRTITKHHAQSIAAKLKCQVNKSGSAHDVAQVFHSGKLIAQFGIRRGSSKDLGHGHIPESLGLRHRQCLDLANCPMSADEFLDVMREKGRVP